MKKVLLVNEASYLNTGYSIYGHNLLKRLKDRFNIAEFCLYGHEEDPRFKSLPWKAYRNMPINGNQEEVNKYTSNPLSVFGAWRFEDVVLDFKPDYVLSIKDPWMDMYQLNSPARNYFNLLWMAPVDAKPLQDEWVEAYSSVDGLLTYQDWGWKILKKQGGDNYNYFGSASPAASDEFKPIKDREKLKQSLGIGPDIKIVGTVMRNQRRKLFPYLFKAFRRFLDETGRNDVILYCHTSYPDNAGWRIPALLKEYKLSSKVVFTYVCENVRDQNGQVLNADCNSVFTSHFQDMVTMCPKCGLRTAKCSSTSNGVTTQALSLIYNMFDLYVQYSNMEGFGMPVCEAAACGVPVCGTDYSAMNDNIRKLNGYPIPVLTLQKEIETGRDSAIPDEVAFVEYLKQFFAQDKFQTELQRIKTRESYLSNYSWDKAADAWTNAINSIPVKNNWNARPNYHNPASIKSINTERMSNVDFARWLIVHVLGDRSKINSQLELRLIRDLNLGAKFRSMGSFYQSDDSALTSHTHYENFSREMAYNELVHLRNQINEFEHKRVTR
jgi:glycosyltransferase involved in cell wall biosynthesis